MAGFYLVLPLAMVIAAAFALVGVYLGLRWNVQVRRGEMPSVGLPGPLNPFAILHEKKIGKEEVSVLDEWLNGAGGKGAKYKEEGGYAPPL